MHASPHLPAAELLRATSRSFYLTLRVLPSRIRDQIGLAYLLARTSDTIADTELLPVEHRLDALERFGRSVSSITGDALDLSPFLKGQHNSAESSLIARAPQIIAAIHTFAPDDQADIVQVLETIIGGQILDLRRFAQADAQQPASLECPEDLDDYTYRVAGCVGEFWTKMCHRHLFLSTKLNIAELLHRGTRFGKGLQLVNILRDLPRDLRAGRCYIPASELSSLGLRPAQLLNPHEEKTFRPLYDRYLGLAHEHLAAGWQYTLALPRRQIRLRLACAWPILIAIRTLDKLAHVPILNPATHAKITRKELRQLLLRSVLLLPWRRRWESQFEQSLREARKSH